MREKIYKRDYSMPDVPTSKNVINQDIVPMQTAENIDSFNKKCLTLAMCQVLYKKQRNLHFVRRCRTKRKLN